MSNQEPDGWVAWHPSEGWSHMIYRSPMDRSKFGPSYDTKWETKPICLIDPQELTQLRKIETIAKSVVEIMWLIDDAKIPLPRVRAGFFRDTYLALSEALSAITAPVEAKPEPKMHTDAFGQPLIGRAKQ